MRKSISAICLIFLVITVIFAACDKAEFSDAITNIEVLAITDTYFAGDDFLFDNVMFNYTYKDGRTLSRKATKEMISGIGELTSGVHTAVLTYGGVTASFTFVVGGVINYVASSGGYINGRRSQRIEYGGMGALVEAIPNEGYQFDQWSDGVTQAKRSESEVVEWGTITAMFSPLKCKVNFYSQNELLESQIVIYGENFREIVPPKGRVLEGYYSAEGQKLKNKTVTQPMDIEVRFEYIPITVNYIGATEAQRILRYNDTLTFPSAFSVGKKLSHWEDTEGNILDTSYIVTFDITVVAVFVVGVHTLSFYDNDSLLFEKNINYGEQMGATETPQSDTKTFSHWVDSEGNTVGEDKVVTEDFALYAVWDNKYYTATFVVGGKEVNYTVRVYLDTVLEKPSNPLREGYNFGGWYADNGYAQSYVFGQTLSEDISIFAKWQPKALALKYVFMYGEREEDYVVYYDSVIALLEPERQDCNFVGWYIDRTLTTLYDNAPLTNSLELYAKWETKTFDVTIKDIPLVGGWIDITTPLPLIYNGLLEFRVIPTEGYRVTEIYIDDFLTLVTQTGTIRKAVAEVQKDLELFARFERLEVGVTVNVASGGSVDCDPEFKVGYGDTLKITITPDSGFSIGLVRVNNITHTVVNGILTINNIVTKQSVNIQFVISEYSITIIASNATHSLSANKITVKHGEGIHFTATANPNYEIEEVRLQKQSGEVELLAINDPYVCDIAVYNIVQNLIIQIKTKGMDGSITASVIGGGGTISPSGERSVGFGSTLPFTITPNLGYQIKNVLFNGVSLGRISEYLYTPIRTSGDVLEITFEPIYLLVNASVTGNGTISNEGISSVGYGEPLTYTITPNDNHHIDYLVVDNYIVQVGEDTADYHFTLGESAKEYDITFNSVKANHTIRAVFSIDKHAVTVTIAGLGRVSLGSGANTLNLTENTTVVVNYGTTLSVYANYGNKIKGEIITINQNTVAVSGSGGSIGQILEDTEIAVEFEPNTYFVEVTVLGEGQLDVASVVEHGQNLEVTIQTAQGWRFLKLWVSGTRVYPNGDTYTVTNVVGNLNIAVEFVIIELNVTVSYNAGGGVVYESSVDYGSDTQITITAEEHYQIASVVSTIGNYSAAVGKNSYTIMLDNLTQDVVIQIQFEKNKYEIRLNIGAGGCLRAESGIEYRGIVTLSVEHGKNTTYAVVADTGKEVSSIKIDGAITALSGIINLGEVTSTHDIQVEFVTKTYTISIMAIINGTVVASSYTVTHGGSVVLTIQPATGYILSILRVNNEAVTVVGNTYVLSNIQRNSTVNATFVRA